MNYRKIAFALSFLALSASACGDDDLNTDPFVIQTLTFLVDGQQFTASSGDATRAGGEVTITGTFVSGGVTRTLTVAIQALAAGSTEIGGEDSPTLTYTEQASGAAAKTWAAGDGAGSGSIVFTELSATKAIGTFTASLPPVTATGATATKALTLGSFNLTF